MFFVKKKSKKVKGYTCTCMFMRTECINFTTIYHTPSKRQTKHLLFVELDELFLGTLHGKRKRLQFKLILTML